MKNKGFTAIEIILSLALLTILTAITIPVYSDFQSRNNLDVSINTLSDYIRQAEFLSRSMTEDSSWGVNISENSITLFKGQSFSSRDPDFDRIFDFNGVSSSQENEIIFSKLKGVPNNNVSITLSTDNSNRVITVNEKGTIFYE